MKKIILGLALAGLVPAVSSAQQIFGQPGPSDAPRWGDLDVMDVLERLTNWLFAILLIAAAIFIIFAAYNFVTAGGDPDKVSKARNFVLYALVGVLVGFIAKGLVLLIDVVVRG